MLVLVLDTATAAVTAGVVETPEVDHDAESSQPIAVRAERVVVNGRGHGELLAPNIQAALRDAAATVRDLSAVVAGLGPGPYTGLRVGLVTAAVLAEALGIPTYGVCTLDAVAGANPGDGELLVATDARRREVYWARYDAARARLTQPDVAVPSAVDLAHAVLAAGPGARLYADVFGLPLAAQDYPTVAALAALAGKRIRSGAPTEALQPLYLRRPDAVAAATSARQR